MSPDRLAELRRQRALVAQHLAWIDAELTAAGTGQPPTPATSAGLPETVDLERAPSSPPVSSPPALPEADPSVVLANARADEIIERYRATEALDPAATKRGCLLVIGALFALGGAVLLAIYYFGYLRN